MKRLLPFLFATLLLGAASCEKIELPSPSTDTPADQTDPDPDDSRPGGEEEGDDGEEEDRPDAPLNVFSVEEAMTLPEDRFVWVEGYIVGYAAGNSRRQLRFSLPTETPNTNMFIADSADERDETRCMAVRLTTDGADFRSQLNLLDHPALFRQPILILGQTRRYFSATGVYTIFEYHLLPTTQMAPPAASRP